ncbi:MAG TPA: response regulator [Ginsengibacter sp.]
MDYSSIDILLVEDNVDDAELAMRELKKNKLTSNLFHVKDGEEALDFIYGNGQYAGSRSTQNLPKVILLDIQMPKVNGIEVLEKIKGDRQTNIIPVVILTSSNESPDIKKCYRLGVNSYIVKPVNFEGYSHAIKELGLYWLLLNRPPEI